jgi:hypothetical protein
MQIKSPLWLARITVFLLGSCILLNGCKPQNAAPPPLTADEIPGAMQKAFTKAKPETRQLVDKLVAALQGKDYPGAYQIAQNISEDPGLTKEQLLTNARAMLGINELLKSASAGGDQSASAFINFQKHNR